jgi:hypothetical protein
MDYQNKDSEIDEIKELITLAEKNELEVRIPIITIGKNTTTLNIRYGDSYIDGQRRKDVDSLYRMFDLYPEMVNYIKVKLEEVTLINV